ncbi:hypothetical protein C8R47DRAFT_1075216 [Mycena vitilis]|nr:hypothetical protein C8R47DRAFT_1075216 [Mycena vitilis]
MKALRAFILTPWMLSSFLLAGLALYLLLIFSCIAGLLAARVCHDHFDCALIVEAEGWVASEEGRKIYKRMGPEATAFARYAIRIPPCSGFQTLLRRLAMDKESYPHIQLLVVTGTVVDVLPDTRDASRLASVLVRTDSGTQEFSAALVAVTRATRHENSRPPPASLDELKIFVRELKAVEPIPIWVSEVLNLLEEVNHSTKVAIVKIPETTYVRYHQATKLPSNCVVLGDSVMTGRHMHRYESAGFSACTELSAVNRLFSEGCTKAFKGALALHNGALALHDVSRTKPGYALPSNLSAKFFAEQFDKTDLMWRNTRLIG